VVVLVAVPAPWAHAGGLALAGSSNDTSVVTLAPGDEIFPGGFEQMFTLAIHDVLAWCDVSVNGGTPTSAPPSSSFEKGRVIPLHGDTANVNLFVWGFWTGGTDGGATDPNMATTVTMSADKFITVCCPDIGFTTCPAL
jgi:hypothetical protein